MEDQKNIVETAIAAGKGLAELKLVPESEYEKTRVLVPEGFRIEEVETQVKPDRKAGEKVFVSAKSFCFYVNKHKSEDETVIIADENQGKVKAILNDHGEESPGFSDFTAVLNLGFSKQFKTWFEKSFNYSEDNKHRQSWFADFIEDHRSDIWVGDFEKDGKTVKNISGLELSDIINNLVISSEEKTVLKRNPSTGETTCTYEVKDSGKSEFKLPGSIYLCIPIYANGDLFRFELRLRFSRGENPRFWFIIDELEPLKQKAFDKICRRIRDGAEDDPDGETIDPEDEFEGTGLEVLKGVF